MSRYVAFESQVKCALDSRCHSQHKHKPSRHGADYITDGRELMACDTIEFELISKAPPLKTQ